MSSSEIGSVFLGMLIGGILLILGALVYGGGKSSMMGDIINYGCDKVIETYNKEHKK